MAANLSMDVNDYGRVDAIHRSCLLKLSMVSNAGRVQGMAMPGNGSDPCYRFGRPVNEKNKSCYEATKEMCNLMHMFTTKKKEGMKRTRYQC